MKILLISCVSFILSLGSVEAQQPRPLKAVLYALLHVVPQKKSLHQALVQLSRGSPSYQDTYLIDTQTFPPNRFEDWGAEQKRLVTESPPKNDFDRTDRKARLNYQAMLAKYHRNQAILFIGEAVQKGTYWRCFGRNRKNWRWVAWEIWIGARDYQDYLSSATGLNVLAESLREPREYFD